MSGEVAKVLELLVQIDRRLDGIDRRLTAVEATAHVQIKGADLEQSIKRLFDPRREAKAREPRCRWTADQSSVRLC